MTKRSRPTTFRIAGRPGFDLAARGVLIVGRRFERVSPATMVACAKLCDARSTAKLAVRAVPAGYADLEGEDGCDLLIGVLLAIAESGEDQNEEGEPVVVSPKQLAAGEAAFATLRADAAFWAAIDATGVTPISDDMTDFKEGLHLVGAGATAVTGVDGDASASTSFDDTACIGIPRPEEGWSQGLVLTASEG